MELKTRATHEFIEIKVDEIETTIFKSDKTELRTLIQNLINVCDTLLDYTEESFSDYINIR